MAQMLDEAISGMQAKYNLDMMEATNHILRLQSLNEKLEHEWNDQYHLIIQLKANLDASENQVRNLEKERDDLKNEVDFYRNNEQK